MGKGVISRLLGVVDSIRQGTGLEIDEHLTAGGRPVRNANGQKVRAIVRRHGAATPFAAEGGRTNRGLPGQMAGLLGLLRAVGFEEFTPTVRTEALNAAEAFLIERVREHLGRRRLLVRYDLGKTKAACIENRLATTGEQGTDGRWRGALSLPCRSCELPNGRRQLASSRLDIQSLRAGLHILWRSCRPTPGSANAGLLLMLACAPVWSFGAGDLRVAAIRLACFGRGVSRRLASRR